jgi:hypothetical protein
MNFVRPALARILHETGAACAFELFFEGTWRRTWLHCRWYSLRLREFSLVHARHSTRCALNHGYGHAFRTHHAP